MITTSQRRRTARHGIAAAFLLVPAWALAVPVSGAASTPASAPPISPAKKAVIAHIVQLQQPIVDNMARQLAEQPAARLLQQLGPLLQARVPAERREAVAKDVQADVKAYVDDVYPLLQKRATAIAPTAFGSVLDDKLSVAELKEVEAFLQSPAVRKYQAAGGDMQRSLAEKLVAETRSTVEPKLHALEQTATKRLGIDPTAPAASGSAPK